MPTIETKSVTFTDINGTTRTLPYGDLNAASWFLSMGNCHSLAAALHEATGYDIIAFRNADDEDEGNIRHVAILTPDNYVLDVEGILDLDTFEYSTSRWGEKVPGGVVGLQKLIKQDQETYSTQWLPLAAEDCTGYVNELLAIYNNRK